MKGTFEEINKGLVEYGDRINELVAKSTEDNCPQIFKVCLFKIMSDAWTSKYIDTNKKMFDEAYELVLSWLEQTGSTIEIKKEEDLK